MAEQEDNKNQKVSKSLAEEHQALYVNADVFLAAVDEGFCILTGLYQGAGHPIDYTFLDFNKVLSLQFGRVLSPGESFLKLDPENESFWLDTFGRIAGSGTAERFEHFFGSTALYFEVYAFRIVNEAPHHLALRFRDITERKNAESILKEKEENYGKLFMSLDQGYLVADVIFNQDAEPKDIFFVECNQAAINMAGRDFKNLHMFDIDPEYEQYWLQIYARVVSTGQSAREVKFAKTHNRWFEFHISRIDLPKHHRVAVVFQDITERRNAKERQKFRLKLSDVLHQQDDPVNAMQEALLLLAEHLNLLRVAYYNIADNQHEMMLAASVETSAVHWPEKMDMSDYAPDISEAYRAGKSYVVHDAEKDERLTAPGREALRLFGTQSLAGVPLVKKGRLCLVLGVHRIDASQWTAHEIQLLEEFAERTWSAVERARAEAGLQNAQRGYLVRLEQEVSDRTAELIESRDKLRSFLDTTLVQMSILKAIRNDAGEITDLEIVAVNQELERETKRKDLVGKLYAAEYPGIKASGIFDLILKTIETGEPQGTEYFYTHEGFQKWFSCTFVKFADGVVGTNMDISSRKIAEEERFRNYWLLKQSEDIASLGSWDYHPTSGAFIWSDGMYRLFDMEVGAEVNPEIYLQYSTEAGKPAAERVVRHILNGDSDFEETLEMMIKGRLIILHIKAMVVYNNSAKAERVLGVDLDISALYAAEKKIRTMEAAQKREIFKTSLSTLEEERNRIAESLHNGIGQILFGIKINLSALEQHQAPDNFAAVKIYTSNLLSQAINETRKISHDLMPTMLEQFGLKAAIDAVCKQLTNGTMFHCSVSGTHKLLAKFMQLAIYRTTQELMTNVVKHSGATYCKVAVSVVADFIKIAVKDNGCGMPLTKATLPGIGLASIRSKIKLLDGSITIDSEPGAGTHIEIIIPNFKNTDSVNQIED
ncbi:MAG: GAF domain-containing protein [Pedobacter sp.]|nr:MAG: GAF domain-containing protein [Pedobacter sp.]